MGALTDEELGKYINKHFNSSFQKVATFRIVEGQKQGGNVAAYFCAQDGRVLHVVAGPVDGPTMLREAKWVVETTERALKEAEGDGGKFKIIFRQAHAQRLKDEYGLIVEPVLYDSLPDPDSALTYRDPTGRALAPLLPPPPIDGPDVGFEARQQNAAASLGAEACFDRLGRPFVLGNQGRVHQVMAAHSMVKIEKVYGTVFENILGEQISTQPVEVVSPFSWLDREGNRLSR